MRTPFRRISLAVALTCLLAAPGLAAAEPAPANALETAQIENSEAAETLPSVGIDLTEHFTPVGIDEIERLFGEQPVQLCSENCSMRYKEVNLCELHCGPGGECVEGICVAPYPYPYP